MRSWLLCGNKNFDKFLVQIFLLEVSPGGLVGFFGLKLEDAIFYKANLFLIFGTGHLLL